VPDSLGDAAQTRMIAQQVAKAAIAEFDAEHPRREVELPDAKVPAPLKWAGVIVAGIMSVGSAGLLFWMISSISQMQLTLARMDERQSMNTTNWEAKFRGLDDRLGRLESQRETQP
jgi:hypothetical protein